LGTEILATLANEAAYPDQYAAVTFTRGGDPLNLLFDRYPVEAQTYNPDQDPALQRLADERYGWDSQAIADRVQIALSFWRADRAQLGGHGQTWWDTCMHVFGGAFALWRLGGADELRAADGGGGGGGGGSSTRGVWVDEGAAMSSKAQQYQSSTSGARSNRVTKKAQAFQLEYTDSTGNRKTVRFDGEEEGVAIDRKLSVTTFPKSKRQALRQSEALQQNNMAGRWEVPTEAQAKRAKNMFSELGITNITVEVVPR
jgi:hypothetical protein